MAQTETCRLCLQNKDLISTLEDEDILQNIRNCVSISISKNDDLPTTVCISCIEKVKDWCSFKEDCMKSQTILVTSLSASTSNSQNTNKIPEISFKIEEPDEIINFVLVDEDQEGDVDEKLYLSDEEFYKVEITDYVYTCDICLQAFDGCMEYLDHQLEHNGESVFKCNKCPEVFSCREDLVNHDQNHKKACPLCGIMILKTSMKLHLIKHTDKFKCPTCGGHFGSKANLDQHIITLHTDIKDHICELCGKGFSSTGAINVHLKSHSAERLYKCKLCSYGGRTASALYAHASTHSNDVCICEVCSKTFKSDRKLNEHIRRVHVKEKKHLCGFCGKKFMNNYRLSVHQRCHTGVRPYSCSVCNKAFNRTDGLKEHMATHSREWHYCEKCKRKFATRKGVARHNCESPNS